MIRPLRLKNGKLEVRESDWSEQINGWLRIKGWECIRTPATRIRYPSGRWGWIFCEGHADWLCVRTNGKPGAVEMFYREDKKPEGKTSKDRKAKQDAWAEQKRNAGYLVCQVQDNCDDPLQDVMSWYKANFK